MKRAAASLLVLLAASRAEARPSARLEHARAAGAEACPSAEAFRSKVAERLGYDPFRDDAPARIAISFASDEGELRSGLSYVDEKGVIVGQRELVSRDPSCTDLADGAALAVAILLEPPRAPAHPTETPAEIAPPDRAPPPPREPPLRIVGTASALAGVGFAPAASVGFAISIGVERSWWSAALEGRADLPASQRYDLGTARTSMRVAELVPCAHLSVAFGCGVIGLGSISAEGDAVVAPRHVTSFYALAGLRLGVDLPVAGPVFARASMDLLAPLVTTTVAVGAADVWTSPAVTFAAQFGAGVRFP